MGGGLAGLVAAVAAAEAGTPVTLHEAHAALGGRARSTAGPYVANEGTHVLYADGPHWRWLHARGLVPAAPLGVRNAAGLRFRSGGRLHRLPPAGVVRIVASRRPAPVDRSFSEWATERYGEKAARAAANLIAVVTYDADPGRLSAAFVAERLRRVFALKPPTVRYVLGGWGALVDNLAGRARELGVRVETGSRLDRMPDGGPVIVATGLDAARRLLGDDSLRWESGRTVLLDVGVTRRRGDAFAVFDADAPGFMERYSAPDPSLAPAGRSLVQAQAPVRPDEARADGLARVEDLLDAGLPGWRERTAWRREAVAFGRTGALDLPGLTWRDRPAVDRGDGVFLAGDAVAAPGMLGEVAVNSGIAAAEGAVRAVGRSPAPAA